ncbi:rhodanese-like domain-containing protein [Thermochromatium tepidum]|jgi:Rhodanese-related sulfurtransferase|uniref:Rhodanese-like domain-containing protein n=1 Tax=Thermochromatium tepidum ATCC 43061 TaxID=316276 RepID=A0A6I6E2L7_THETI|nr:rhodanese-like domain-containing protein [Thermochromatium tepidum]QGU31952.1 rhodanese-like domain-containing protein [Thermochromatium tepidum ATCC 43061]
MSQLIEFIGNHWFLFLALIVILGLLTHNLIVGGKGSVGPLQATELINHREAVIIDVRPAADYARGHIINALNIPMNGFNHQLATLNKYKGRPIIVNCRSGAQSAVACAYLRKAGFEEVYNLQGGILAWESANLPLTRKKR